MTPEIQHLITRHARDDLRTPISGLALSRVDTSEPEYSLTEPLFVLMAQGAKRLRLGEQEFAYRTGEYLIVTTDLPVTGQFVETPALGLGLALRAEDIAPLLVKTPPTATTKAPPTAITKASPTANTKAPLATGAADDRLLDAVVRLLRLLDRPGDAPVLAPLVVTEILWLLLTGPHGALIRGIGSDLSHLHRAVRWIRANYAEPLRIDDLARLAGLSTSAFHRQFRSLTSLSPLQFQKRIRLQEARALLITDAGDVARVGHLVGYDSPSQFSREYRRLFGAPPGQDAARLHTSAPTLP